MEVRINNKWENHQAPIFTIMTPVYNRRETIKRTMNSVEKQTFSSIEYIIIDDGSTNPADDIISEFMDSTQIPVMYVKKENGGVHTARNVGIERANGLFFICIDSDDELMPNACKCFYDEWNRIPESDKDNIWQIKALCIDQNGLLSSSRFPDNINILDPQEAKRFFSMAKGEQLGCRLTSVLKNNKFPEPREVKFVNENNLWLKLESQYKSWGLNEVVRIYHTEGSDRLCGVRKKTLQNCIDSFWNSYYSLENAEYIITNKKEYVFELIRYFTMRRILQTRRTDVIKKYCLSIKNVKTWHFLMFIPSVITAFLYENKRME